MTEQDQTEIIEISGKPFFIKETNGGLFGIVKEISLKNSNPNGIFYQYFEEHLKIGENIREIPNRSISIVCNYLKKGDVHIMRSIVEECKKYAQVTMSDYVCLENFGGFMSQDIGNNMIIIRPRIFTKIVDN